MHLVLPLCVLSAMLPVGCAFTKVLVPSFHKEWISGMPDWAINTTIMEEYGYIPFLYQKLYPNQPNFISTNRGGESGVYLRYIVDHYDNFPDIAIFVHAHPEDHQPDWLKMIKCISPNATYFNFNNKQLCRPTSMWKGFHMEAWQEQCWRDVLKIVWELEDNIEEFNKRVPTNRPIMACFICCNQFLISRDMIRRRPLKVWKKLLEIIGVQDVCHVGEPDYANLYAQDRIGPEQADVAVLGEGPHNKGWGHWTQAMAMEHLAHVIFGFLDIDMSWPNMDTFCTNYIPNCPSSPCTKQ